MIESETDDNNDDKVIESETDDNNDGENHDYETRSHTFALDVSSKCM